jgi:TrmH family RNA methyltransferase
MMPATETTWVRRLSSSWLLSFRARSFVSLGFRLPSNLPAQENDQITQTDFDLTFIRKRRAMLVKSQVKYIQSLGQKKFRDQEGAFVAEGPRLVGELLDAPNLSPLLVYATKAWLEDGENVVRLRAVAASAIIELSEQELERIAAQATPNQVLAVFAKPRFPPPSFDRSVSLLLDGIQDPGNLGTIIRIADWFGIRQVACSRDCADAYNPKTVQSTMGSIGRVAVIVEDLEKLIGAHPGLLVYAAVLRGESIYKMAPVDKGMIVIGNESKGISRELLELIAHPVTIPRIGEAESLNAAVATGIVLSHLLGR